MSSTGKKEQPSAAKSVEIGTHKTIVTEFIKKPPTEEPERENKSNLCLPEVLPNILSEEKTPTTTPTPTLDFELRPLILATHLVPSLPIGLFELLAEAIETAIQRPVNLIHESRRDRPVAKEVVDLAFLPAFEEWEDGDLLPVTFVFAHRLNDSGTGNVYVDVIVASDRAAHIEDIMDLRGHRCALPDRHRRKGAAALLLGDLRSKGEGPAFFGNTLDSSSQLEALQMVAGRQAEVGVLEAPVLRSQRRKIPGAESLSILGSLGPLPPYAIYVNKSVSAQIRDSICSYLLVNVSNDKYWSERFSVYGVNGFTKNSTDAYIMNEDDKDVVTSVRYY